MTDHEAQTLAMLAADGWRIVNTNRCCTAFRKDSPVESNVYALLQNEDGIDHYSEEDRYKVYLCSTINDTPHVLEPHYWDLSSSTGMGTAASLAACHVWATEKLRVPPPPMAGWRAEI